MRYLAAFCILCLVPLTAKAESFDQWLTHFKQRAVSANVSAELLDEALRDVRLDVRVIKLDRKQPEGHMTLAEYVDKTLTDRRIATGRAKFSEYRSLLKKVERNTGVPAEIMVALWGKETDFGGYTGDFNTINSLATLAYEGRRRAYFEQELLEAIYLLRRMGWPPSRMTGSWAGAVGQCQFMPSNYLRIAVDGDGNGKIDLWNNMPDVFASMANLLVKEGWRAHESWGQKITIPARFDKNLIGRDKSPQDLRFWEQRGVRFTQSVPSSVQRSIRLYQPDGPQGPAYAIYPNFDVLMRWNRSGYFATAVGRLADHVAAQTP